MNVAIGMSRLGLPTTLHTRIGPDEFGDLISGHLHQSGVTITAESRDSGPTSVAAARIGGDGTATYEFAIDASLADLGTSLARFEAVHSGSIAAALDPGAERIEQLLKEARPFATISFDPNVRSQLLGDRITARARVARLVAIADVVKASDEDLEWLYPEASVDAVAEAWLASGPSVVAVTRGGNGSTALCAAGSVAIPSPEVTVIDTIGAGDSYMAAMIAGLAGAGLLGADRRESLKAIAVSDLEEVIRLAAECAGMTVSRRGANPPNREELETHVRSLT
jgi:fructokinase